MNPLEQGAANTPGRRGEHAPLSPREDPAALRGEAGSAGGQRLLPGPGLPADPSAPPAAMPKGGRGPARGDDVTVRRTLEPVAPARWRCGMGSPAGAPAKRARCDGPRGPGSDHSDPRLWDTERLCQHLSRCGVGDPSLLRRFRGTAGRGRDRGRDRGRAVPPLALTLLLLPQRAESPEGCCWTCRPAPPSSSASGEGRPRGNGSRGPGAAAGGPCPQGAAAQAHGRAQRGSGPRLPQTPRAELCRGNGHPGADPRPSEHFPFPADPSTTTARALAAQITMKSKKVDLLEKV